MAGKHRRMMALAVGALGLVAAVGIAGCSDKGSSKSTSTSAPRIGDDVKLDQWTATVNSVQNPYTAANLKESPKAGNKYVAADVTIRNNSKKPGTIASADCLRLEDGSGKTYEKLDLATSPAAPNGTVAPTEALRGLVVFEVPSGATDLKLKLRCNLFSKKQATIPL